MLPPASLIDKKIPCHWLDRVRKRMKLIYRPASSRLVLWLLIPQIQRLFLVSLLTLHRLFLQYRVFSEISF